MSPAALLVAPFGSSDLCFVHTGNLIGSTKAAPVGITPSPAQWSSLPNQRAQREGDLEVFAHKPDDSQDHGKHGQSPQNAPNDLGVDGNCQRALLFFGALRSFGSVFFGRVLIFAILCLGGCICTGRVFFALKGVARFIGSIDIQRYRAQIYTMIGIGDEGGLTGNSTAIGYTGGKLLKGYGTGLDDAVIPV